MKKTANPWYWEDTAMLILVPAIILFFFCIGMWLAVIRGEFQWYVALPISAVTFVLAVLFLMYVDEN